MTEQQAAEAPEVEAGEPESLESIAREAGWKPAEEWKGDPPPGGFLSPAQYVKAQAQKASSLSKELSQFRKETERRIERMERQSKAKQEAEREALHKEYNHWIKMAVKAGNTEQFERLTKEKEALDAKAADEPPSLDDMDDDDFVQAFSEAFEPAYPRLQTRFFQDGHAWLLDDDADPEALQTYADILSGDGAFADNLEKADRILRKAFPDKYASEADEPERKTPKRAPVLAPGGRSAKTGGYAARLTPEQRQIAQRNVAEGLFGSIEEWAEVRFRGES